jgi:hypothetical protein
VKKFFIYEEIKKEICYASISYSSHIHLFIQFIIEFARFNKNNISQLKK